VPSSWTLLDALLPPFFGDCTSGIHTTAQLLTDHPHSVQGFAGGRMIPQCPRQPPWPAAGPCAGSAERQPM